MTVLKNQLNLFGGGRRRPESTEAPPPAAPEPAELVENAPPEGSVHAPAPVESAPADLAAPGAVDDSPDGAAYELEDDLDEVIQDAALDGDEAEEAFDEVIQDAARDEGPATAEAVPAEQLADAPASVPPAPEDAPPAEIVEEALAPAVAREAGGSEDVEEAAAVEEAAPAPVVEAPAAAVEEAPTAAATPDRFGRPASAREPFLFPPAEEARRGDLHFSRRISDLIRRLQLLERETKKGELGLTLPQAHALHALEEAGSLRMQELAGALGLAQSTVTRLVAPLKRMGLLDRRPDRNDGRATRAFLTDTGRHSVDQLEAAERRLYTALIERLPETRRAEVIAAVELLHEVVLDVSSER